MSKYTETVMQRVRDRFSRSDLSLEVLGAKMGYKEASARKSAWQFLHKTADPRLSMLKKVADALGVDLRELFYE